MRIKYLISELSRNAKLIDGVYPLVVLDMVFCGIVFGASPSNYKNFDFYHASLKERASFITHRDSEKMMKKYNNPGKTGELENKLKFAELFGDLFNRSFAESDKLDMETLVRIAKHGKVIYKPFAGGQGRGIKTYTVTSSNINAILDELIALPVGIVEEWITQNDEIASFNPDSVNPLRIQSLLEDDEVNILAATITLGNGTAIANASAVRAIFALVDVKTGIVSTDGYDYNGEYYLQHPITQKAIKGFQVPYWKEVVGLIQKAGKRIPEVKYVGWDVAIGEDGPVLIEGNNDPGYTAYQLPMLTQSHTGIKPIVEKITGKG